MKNLFYSAAQAQRQQERGWKLGYSLHLDDDNKVVAATAVLDEGSTSLFENATLVANVKKNRMVADKNGESANRDKWAEWGYTPPSA